MARLAAGFLILAGLLLGLLHPEVWPLAAVIAGLGLAVLVPKVRDWIWK